MIALTHFRDDGAAGTGTGASGADGTFEERAERALAALAARPGYLRGQLARSMDDTGDWLLLTEWESVGAYRRALGNFDVRINATQLLATALDIPGTFEPLLLIERGATQRRASDRADDDPELIPASGRPDGVASRAVTMTRPTDRQPDGEIPCPPTATTSSSASASDGVSSSPPATSTAAPAPPGTTVPSASS